MNTNDAQRSSHRSRTSERTQTGQRDRKTAHAVERQSSTDVIIIGAGVAGLTAGIYTAHAGLETVLVDGGDSLLRRNAHLENVPGFPAGVNPRLFLDMVTEQARRSGCLFVEGRVTDVERTDTTVDGRFTLRLEDDRSLFGDSVVAASWSDSDYLDGLEIDRDERGSKGFIQVDATGRTGVDGVYAAGRLADQYHQTVISAGHGAQVAITLIHDSDIPYYHDWIAPEGYFTDRGRAIPPGCEEIDADERHRREELSRAVMCEYFTEPHPDEQTTHPSLEADKWKAAQD